MNEKIRCYFGDVSEHDMDILFLEEFVCSEAFLQIFTDEIGPLLRSCEIKSTKGCLLL